MQNASHSHAATATSTFSPHEINFSSCTKCDKFLFEDLSLVVVVGGAKSSRKLADSIGSGHWNLKTAKRVARMRALKLLWFIDFISSKQMGRHSRLLLEAIFGERHMTNKTKCEIGFLTVDISIFLCVSPFWLSPGVNRFQLGRQKVTLPRDTRGCYANSKQDWLNWNCICYCICWVMRSHSENLNQMISLIAQP